MNTVRTFILAAAIAAALGAPQTAHSGAVVGATEFTQIANNIELIMQYAKQVQHVMYTVKQYETMLKQLKQLDPGKAKDLLKSLGLASIEEATKYLVHSTELSKTLTGLNEDLSILYFEADRAHTVLRNLRSRGIEMDGATYLQGMAELARVKGAEYQTRHKNLTESLERAQNHIRRADQIVTDAPKIESTVGGLAALQVSNGQMLVQLGEIQAINAWAAQAQVEQTQLATKKEMERAEAMQAIQRMTDLLSNERL